MDPATRALLIDLGQVLLGFDHMITCRALAGLVDLAPEEVHRRLFATGIERDFDLGRLDEATFVRRVRLALQAPRLGEAVILEAWANIFERYDEHLALLEPLASRYRLVLASNTNVTHFRQAEILAPELAQFHARVLSYEEGVRKPDEAFFRLAVARAEVPVEECLFIDDSMKNLAGAETLELPFVHHRPGHTLARSLRSAGVEI